MNRQAPSGVLGGLMGVGVAPRVAASQPRAPMFTPGPIVTAYAIKGSRLAELRESAGLTQRALAIKTAEAGARVSQANIERVESHGDGLARVTEETARSLAAGLGVEMAELFQ
mgnify:CR=1 FL=1